MPLSCPRASMKLDATGLIGSPEDVAGRIRRVLKPLRPEQVWINPDRGFGWSPRYMCNQKIQSMAAGARLAREEVGRG